MPVPAKPAQWQRYLTLVIIGLFGLLLSLAAQQLELGFWRAALEHSGTAIFIAAALGLTIDYWLKKQITEDVFSAAMGYELPDDLRKEIRFVYGNRVLCEEHSQTVWLTDLKNGFVTCCVGTERTFRNIGETDYQMPIHVALDEWHVVGHPSQILEIAYEQDGQRANVYPEGVDLEDRPWGPAAKWRGQLRLGPQKTATVFVKISETRPDNGEHFYSFSHATLNPNVQVNAPEGFKWLVSFAHRDKAKEGKYSASARLEGLLLPHQSIRVRWWRDFSSSDSSSIVKNASPSA